MHILSNKKTPYLPPKNHMSRKYNFLSPTGMHYTTSTIVGWIDIFTRQIYRDIVIESLQWCQQHKGLQIYAFVLMTNHIHLVSETKDIPLADVLGTFKRHTAAKIIEAVEARNESRKEWLLRLFKCYGQKKGQVYQVWQHENHPIALWSQKVTGQKIDYLHQNPVRAGLVNKASDWRYSSAGQYAGLKIPPPVLEVEVIDAWGLE